MLPATYEISPVLINLNVSVILYFPCILQAFEVQLLLGTKVSVDPVSNNTLNFYPF